LSPKFLFAVAIFFGIAGIAIWAVFLRSSPIQTAAGSITKKTFKPAGTYWQYPAGLSRGFQLATPIPIAEANVFELAVNGFDGPIFFSLNTIASQHFCVGQNVLIHYQEKTIPFIARRVYVIDMLPAD
jgi:hypothetical protein